MFGYMENGCNIISFGKIYNIYKIMYIIYTWDGGGDDVVVEENLQSMTSDIQVYWFPWQ